MTDHIEAARVSRAWSSGLRRRIRALCSRADTLASFDHFGRFPPGGVSGIYDDPAGSRVRVLLYGEALTPVSTDGTTVAWGDVEDGPAVVVDTADFEAFGHYVEAGEYHRLRETARCRDDPNRVSFHVPGRDCPAVTVEVLADG